MTEPQQPGWYPDYTQPGTERWHDGQQWTQATRLSGAPPTGHGAKAKRRKWPWIVGGVILLLVIIGVASNSGKKSPAASSTSPSATVATTAPATTAVTTTTKPKPPAPPAAKVVLRLSGDGTKNSQNFTITSDQWTVAYTYTCPSQTAIFQIYLWHGDVPVDVPANTTTPSGKDSTTEHGAGTYYLQMNTTCTWTVTVTD